MNTLIYKVTRTPHTSYLTIYMIMSCICLPMLPAFTEVSYNPWFKDMTFFQKFPRIEASNKLVLDTTEYQQQIIMKKNNIIGHVIINGITQQLYNPGNNTQVRGRVAIEINYFHFTLQVLCQKMCHIRILQNIEIITKQIYLAIENSE